MQTKKDAPGQTHLFIFIHLFCDESAQELEALDLDAQAEERMPEELMAEEPAAEELFDIQAVGVPNRKRRGEISEAIFLGKACGLGFSVAKPWGDSEPYDFILNGGHGFLRVQVKSTARYKEETYRVKAAGWDDDPYTSDDIDFLVAYVVPEEVWYVVPIEAFESRGGLCFYPHGRHKARYEIYREAWCLMASAKDAKGKTGKTRNAKARGAGGKLGRGVSAKLPACLAAELAVRCAVCPLRK